MLKKYLCSKALIIFLTVLVEILVGLILSLTGTSWDIVFLTYTIVFIFLVLYLITDYLQYKKEYKKISNLLEKLEKKYLIIEMLESPKHIQGQLYFDILKKACHDMVTEISKTKGEYLDYREYLEEWIHEMKTPLTTISLIQPFDLNYNMRLKKELSKLSNLLETSLYYIRSNSLEKDYYIKEFNLSDIIHNTILQEKEQLQSKNIEIKVNLSNEKVYFDEKWIGFIFHQILLNSIQYVDIGGKINIYDEINRDGLTLIIKDNGCGIPASDISRIFEKGFTGKNRRKDKASGIGLYLCKKSADKMNLGLSVESKEGEYTKIKLFFPKGDYRRIFDN